MVTWRRYLRPDRSVGLDCGLDRNAKLDPRPQDGNAVIAQLAPAGRSNPHLKGTLHFNINLGSKVSLDPP